MLLEIFYVASYPPIIYQHIMESVRTSRKHMDAIIKKGIVGITGSKTPIIPNIKKKKPMLINKNLLKQLTLVPAFCLLFAQWALGIPYNSSSNYLSLDFSSAVPPQDNSCDFEVVAFEYLSLSY